MASDKVQRYTMHPTGSSNSTGYIQYSIYDDDVYLGKMHLLFRKIIDESQKMGDEGRITNPQPDQLPTRIILDLEAGEGH